MNKKILFLFLIVMFFCVGSVSANDLDNANQTSETQTIHVDDSLEENTVLQTDNEESCAVGVNSSQEVLKDSSDDVIIVNNWDELQYYCSLTDNDYTLKLKENTNFYPSNLADSSYQIRIKNNVKIIGSEGSWIGDETPNARSPMFIGMVVPDDERVGLTLENVTFKWILVQAGFNVPDGMFIKIGGKKNTLIKNCLFENLDMRQGHSCVVHLNKGTATFDNCSFINCHTFYGVLSVYNSGGASVDMTVQNCYFEGNYARTEPGCINNCGKLTVYNTTFYKNRAGSWAGAIHTHSGASAFIYDSNFIDNVAGWNGGALYTYGTLKVYNSSFIGNNCTTDNGGGAIGACEYGSSPQIYIEHCLFKDNTNNCWVPDSLSDGTGRGGAISIMDRGSLEVRDTTFIANAAAQGTAICAIDAGSYGSPDVYIINNSFINHTRAGDVLKITTKGKIVDVHDNYYLGNSIVFSDLTLTKISEGKEQATFKVTASLSHPTWYDSDILDKTLYDVYINNNYVKTVNTTTFSIDFGDLDICDVYVIPTISNRKSNVVTATSTREYVFVSKSNGNDSNNGISRQYPVYSIAKALELARGCQNIILLDGEFSEGNLLIDYGVTIKGEGNATLTGNTSFVSDSNFTLKNLKIKNLSTGTFIKHNSNNLVISNCIITNNNALLVQNNGFATIVNSILLNNTGIIEGSNFELNYNWWGNTLPDFNINNYITLNITSDVDALENNQKANVKAVFYLNDGTKYNSLPEINLDITAINGVVNHNITGIDSNVVYTLTAFDDGVLSVNYNDFTLNKTFEFVKSNPTMSLAYEDIMYGDDLVITVTLPGDSEGNLTVHVDNIPQSKVIESAKTVFTFTDLKADTYIINVSYTGDKKYQSKTATASVTVNKYLSNTSLTIGEVVVGEDVFITVKTTETSTGNVTLTINDEAHTLYLVDSTANYTIKNIPRGDYLIRALYNGDDKYLTSEAADFFEVDNLNATMTLSIDDITFGETVLIKVTLNDDATGIVTATVDGIANSSSLTDGKAEIRISNLEAGFKNVTVFYSGDDTYFNLTQNSNFTINKADLAFNITVSDIMIGQSAEIVITVPAKTKGTFTINEDVITIPMSGEITYVIGDLEIGEYTYVAVYNGNDYNTVSQAVSFSVLEYPIPQWPNNGNDPGNTQKSECETLTNGEIAFTIEFNQTLVSDIVIDSIGNIYLTTASGIYCFNRTDLLWEFSSSAVLGNFSGASIGRDVVVVPKSGDTLYFIIQTTGEKYGSSNIYQGSSLFAPVIDANATLYIASEYQYASNDYKLVIIPYKIWENGGEPTLVSLGNYKPLFSPTVGENIIVVLSENMFRVIDANSLRAVSTKSGNYTNARPIIGEGDVIYCVLSNNVIAYTRDAVQLWKTKVTGNPGTVLALDSQQGLYHVNSKGTLYRYDLIDGKESKVCDLTVTSGILVGGDGTLYFGSDNIFYALDKDGTILWKTDLNDTIIGNPVMDNAGLIYVATEGGVVALTNAPLKDPGISIDCPDIFVSEDANITITIDNGCINEMTITFMNETYTASGVFNKVIPNLAAGNYTIDVSYDGDARFASQNKTHTFEVKKHPADLIITTENVNHEVVVSINTIEEIKKVNLDINGSSFVVDLLNGKGSVEINNLSAGSYLIIASIDDDYYCGINTTKLEITAYKTQIRITSIDGAKMEITGILTDEKSSPISNATLFYTLNSGEKINATTDENGEFIASIENNCIIDMVFEGEGTALPSNASITVKNLVPSKKDTVIEVPSNFERVAVDYKAGEKGSMFYFTLKDADGNPLPDKGVKIGIFDKIYTVKTDKDGKGGLQINVANANYYTYAISFLGDDDYRASFAVSSLHVVKKPVTITPAKTSYTFKTAAKTKTITATLKSSNSYIPKGKQVTLTIAGKTFKATIGDKGQISFNIGSITKKGTYKVAIKFAGTNTYADATSKTINVVIK